MVGGRLIVGGRTGGWEGAGGWYGGCGGAADTDTDVTIKTDAKKEEMESFTKDTPIACHHGKDRSFQNIFDIFVRGANGKMA